MYPSSVMWSLLQKFLWFCRSICLYRVLLQSYIYAWRFQCLPRLLHGRETLKSYPNSHFCFQSNDNQFLLELIGGPLKTRNMSACVQEGRIFAENETWIVDSCTTCTCKVSSTDKFSCRQKCPAQGRHVQINTCRS